MKRNLDISYIVLQLKSLLNKKQDSIPLHQPEFTGKEWIYIKDCLETGWVSSAGKYVEEFERRLSEFTGVKHAIAVVNGTAALHLALKLIGVEEGDEVLLPALTFVATANAVHYCGAVPHFIDSDFKSLGIDPYKMEDYLREISIIKKGICYNKETLRPIKALIAMHTFGFPVDLDPILELCNKYKLQLIEDAAEALGSYYKNKHAGGFGRVSILSFNGNKIITTGGGGAILTNDSLLAMEAKHLSTTAKVPHPWAYIHDRVGFNYRLPNVNAAIGFGQLEGINQFIQLKRALAERYQEAFKGVHGVTFFKEPSYARSNYWLNVLILERKYAEYRDILLEETHKQGIITRPPWTLMHKLNMYKNCPRMDLSIAQELEARIINLPSSAGLGVDGI